MENVKSGVIQRAKSEALYGSKSIIFNEGLNEYQKTFQKVFDFEGWLKNKVNEGKTNLSVLDIMAETEFLTQLQNFSRSTVDKSIKIQGIAISLGDHRIRQKKVIDTKRKLFLVSSKIDKKTQSLSHSSDIAEDWVWNKLNAEQQKNNFPNKFDLIVNRGAGGMEHFVEEGFDTRYKYLIRVSNLLAEGGTFITQLQSTDNPLLPFYTYELQDKCYEVEYVEGNGRRDKIFDSSAGLPVIKIVKSHNIDNG